MRKAYLSLCILFGSFTLQAQDQLGSSPQSQLDDIEQGQFLQQEDKSSQDLDEVNLIESFSPEPQQLTNNISPEAEKGIALKTNKQVSVDQLLKKPKDERKTHWANIVALICGCITFLFGYLALPSIIFGAIGMAKSGKNKEYKGKGMGIVGLVAGILGLAVYFAVIAAA